MVRIRIKQGTSPETRENQDFLICRKVEGSIGQTNLGDLLFFLIFLIFYGFFGVYIFPKWLKKVPGHIPILFG